MRDRIGHDDTRDAELRAALRASAPRPPVEDVDWAALHTRIRTDAQPLLARPVSARLLHVLGAWSWRGSLLAGSAAAVMALALGLSTAAGGGDAGSALQTLEEELAEAVPSAARPLLLAGTEAEAMLDAVLFSEAEEW